MREWFITGADLCGIIVKARKSNPEYNTGQVIREV